MNYSDYRTLCNSHYLPFHSEAVFTLAILPAWNVFHTLYDSEEMFLKAINGCSIQSLLELLYYSKMSKMS